MCFMDQASKVANMLGHYQFQFPRDACNSLEISGRRLSADVRLMGTWVRIQPFASKPSSILRPHLLSSDGSIGYEELKSSWNIQDVVVFLIDYV